MCVKGSSLIELIRKKRKQLIHACVHARVFVCKMILIKVLYSDECAYVLRDVKKYLVTEKTHRHTYILDYVNLSQSSLLKESGSRV